MVTSVHEISTDGQHLREVFKATGGPYGSISKQKTERETDKQTDRQMDSTCAKCSKPQAGPTDPSVSKRQKERETDRQTDEQHRIKMFKRTKRMREYK